MRFFGTFLPAVGIAMLGAVSVLAQCSDTILAGLNEVTQASRDLRDVVEAIEAGNVLTQGPKVAAGLTQIGQTVTTLTQQISQEIAQGNCQPFPDDVAEDVVDAFVVFVMVHQDLLDTIIGKHGILQYTPFGPPIAAALRSLEAIVDAFAYLLISLIPTRPDDIKGPLMDLDQTFTDAISTYS
ncbi:hypothetical protein GY45DRAFT_354207 [Cubamyces sp. BRFM 1775]|nr:hypothetical protein GY45DRAFT_354207 [Cubamyces sp. BRFM 1775]